MIQAVLAAFRATAQERRRAGFDCPIAPPETRRGARQGSATIKEVNLA
jgi:hypothetical protein